jgi:hypothetical protein
VKEAWRTAIKGREAGAYLRELLAKSQESGRRSGSRPAVAAART